MREEWPLARLAALHNAPVNCLTTGGVASAFIKGLFLWCQHLMYRADEVAGKLRKVDVLTNVMPG